MFKQSPQRRLFFLTGNILPVSLFIFIAALPLFGCSNPFNKQTITASNGDKIDLNDEDVKRYVEEWHDAKPSIDRLTKLEGDLDFLLGEVSKMSDLGQVPGLARAGGMQPNIPAESYSLNAADGIPYSSGNSAATPYPTIASGNYQNTLSSGAGYVNPESMFCPEPSANNYKKSIAFASFPRVETNSSKFGALYKVEQHLPMLIGANLYNRHSMLAPLQLRESFLETNKRSESLAAAQAKMLSQQHRVQFVITGDIDDMSPNFPNDAHNPSYYTRVKNGVQDFFRFDSDLDSRNRVFSFNLQVRDGLTGQVIFTKQYKTLGKWESLPQTEVGFGTPRFWLTDYGKQVQMLVASASDEVANIIQCQPYIAKVDARPGQQQVVIQSGINNGLRTGDSFDLYQMVYEPVTGEYQAFNTRLIKRSGRVYLTETYPSHSIGHVVDDTLMGGQYVVKAM